MIEVQIHRSNRWEIQVVDSGKVIAGIYKTESKVVDMRAELRFDYQSLPEPGEHFKYAEFWREDPCVPIIEDIIKKAYPGCKIRWML